jgi:hypothetical protein
VFSHYPFVFVFVSFEFRAPNSHSSRYSQIGVNRFIRSASFAGGAFMLQNRLNQIARVQIAARRNLDQVALVAGTPHLLSMSKRRLYSSMYGKRPSSPTQPQFESWRHSDPQTHLGSGSGGTHCTRSRLHRSAVVSGTMLRESERQHLVSGSVTGSRVVPQGRSVPTVATSAARSVWQIPATAWAAFAIQKAIRG